MIKNLKCLRQKAGISQQQLADIVLVSQQSINKYENHDIEPDIETLVRIADYFNVSLDYLVGRTDIKERIDKMRMSDLSDDEEKIIVKFRGLNTEQKKCIDCVMDSYK